jgi:hypothetical protein
MSSTFLIFFHFPENSFLTFIFGLSGVFPVSIRPAAENFFRARDRNFDGFRIDSGIDSGLNPAGIRTIPGIGPETFAVNRP